jgi:valyl-tRNA synthetase
LPIGETEGYQPSEVYYKIRIVMEKQYQPQETEKRIYAQWEKEGYFTPKIEKAKKPYSITLPPPNVTGSLHAGHAMMVVQDIIARFYRMLGQPTLFLPGFDHASIAVEALICKQLRQENKTKKDLGRHEFLKRAEKFANDSRKYIKNQLKLIGFSLDWSREAYTFDQIRTQAVNQAFVRLFEKNLIYQGERIINWCSDCQTAISDLENEYQEEKSQLYFINYPLILRQPSATSRQQNITIATTRPETIFADTAIAVHPQDKRYRSLVGKKVKLPLTDREIPLIADKLVDPDFGSGALKITPGHDQLDFEIGRKHQLENLIAVNFDGRLTKLAGEFVGLTIETGRKAVVTELKKGNYLEKIEDYQHSVGHCQRCGTKTEPLISKQWFVKIKPLAKKAITAVKKGQIKILPRRFNKIYFQWLENIRDWCISRQLWWGHQIPVYYCQEKRNQKCLAKDGIFASAEKPKKCPYCQSLEIKQDEDILDTWFSSSLWPISVLGWPQKTQDYQYFYPTSLRETGYDILFFWVAREVMMCLEMTDKTPFKTIYLHGLVRDKAGQKFSKSTGIGFDPIEVIEKYGADALRMALVVGTTPGNDIRIDQDKIKGYRNFTNKVWNIGRFIVLNSEKIPQDRLFYDQKMKTKLTKKDREILKQYQELVNQVTKNLKSYKLSPAGEAIYQFLWHELADKYVEDAKTRIEKKDPVVLAVLGHVFRNCLKLLHPFMPFVTEEIWSKMPKKYDQSIIISKWPN